MTFQYRQFACRAVLLAAAGVLALGGCESTAPIDKGGREQSDGTPLRPGFARFDDVPTPRGAEMDLERSLVLGERDAWIGRLVMSTGLGVGEAYDFYAAEMPRFDWMPITSIRSETSVLTFGRGSRIATLQIRRRTLGGSRIDLTMSPRGAPAAPAPVSTTPLR